jgi:nucleoside-diphosphate-sugar epimerase
MKVVLIGASGNIGTALLERLRLLPEHEVHAIARRKPSFAEPAAHVAWHESDIRADDLVPLLQGADVVVNLAWLFHPSHSSETTWASNVGGTTRLLEAIHETSVPRLIHSSSIAAYAPRVGEAPVDETWPTSGASSAAYAREKAYIERLLDIFERDRPSTAVVRVRPAFVFQRRAATQQRRLFGGPLVPGRLIRPSLIPLVPFPSGLRLQAIHTADVADALVLALGSDFRGALNLCADDVLGSGDVATLPDAHSIELPARAVKSVLQLAWTLHLAPADPQVFDALMSLPTLANDAAKRELGWRPTHGAGEALAAFLDGLRHGVDHPTPPLDDESSGRLRSREFMSGLGARE